MSVPLVTLDEIGYMGWQLPAPEALNICLDQRSKSLIRARQAKHDMAWFAAHDPAEYEMQMLKDPVAMEVSRARRYHHKALEIRALMRSIPQQQSLFEEATP